MSSAKRKVWLKYPWFSWLCALSPWFFFLALATMSLHVRLSFRHWPADAIDDFDGTLLRVHNTLLMISLLLAVAAIPAWLIFLILIRELRLSWSIHVIQAGVYVLSWGIIFNLIMSIPAEWLTWMLD
jgi:hypothetical protein